MSGIELAKQKLHSFLHSKQIPNLILHGPSGSGKRTLLSEFLYEVYRRPDRPKDELPGRYVSKQTGRPLVRSDSVASNLGSSSVPCATSEGVIPERSVGIDIESTYTIIKSNVMVVNCSHGNKGIKFIRDEFKFFAKTNIQTNYGVPFKSIVLLNADCLTIDAQTALRRCIELFSHSTRFFIIVKDKHRLLNPILSRFCEIHVPEPETGSSFHQQQLVRQFPSLYESDKSAWPVSSASIAADATTTLHAADLMTAATQWYEQGKSALHLIRMLSEDPNNLRDSFVVSPVFDTKATATLPPWLSMCDSLSSIVDRERANLVILCFYKIKDDIRHEKTLIFHVLFAVHLCSKLDIKNMLMM